MLSTHTIIFHGSNAVLRSLSNDFINAAPCVLYTSSVWRSFFNIFILPFARLSFWVGDKYVFVCLCYSHLHRSRCVDCGECENSIKLEKPKKKSFFSSFKSQNSTFTTLFSICSFLFLCSYLACILEFFAFAIWLFMGSTIFSSSFFRQSWCFFLNLNLNSSIVSNQCKWKVFFIHSYHTCRV